MDWRAKQEFVVAQSTMESEFIALAFAVRDFWIKKFKWDLEKMLDWVVVYNLFDTTVNERIQVCIEDVRNASVSALSRHVDLMYQLIVYNVKKGKRKMKFVSPESMVADLLEKHLSVRKFKDLKAQTDMEQLLVAICPRASVEMSGQINDQIIGQASNLICHWQKFI